MQALSPGSELGGYRLESIAGQGGMGIVYRATQLALDRPVAMKLIAPALAEDETFRERFKRESRLAAAIDHPNVIPVYEAGEADGHLFIAMRYVEGTDLGTTIARDGRLTPAEAIRTVEQIAAALDAAHRRGLVHRDVKPANVLISGDERRHVYLTDFGLTKNMTSAGGGPTKTGQLLGTLDYAPPEQIEGRPVDPRADVYSLGCVLFHAATGRPPYVRDNDAALIYAHLSAPLPAARELAADLPDGFDEVIAGSLAKDPGERFETAGDLAQAAVSALDAAPAPAETAVSEPAAAALPADAVSGPNGALLERYRAGDLAQLDDSEGAELERLLGTRGGTPAERLGLPPDADDAALRQALLEALDRWQRRAEHPLSPRAVVDASRALVRACEEMLAALPSPPSHS